ncbi:hypothetical protein D1872_202020 [compost metagenome]
MSQSCCIELNPKHSEFQLDRLQSELTKRLTELIDLTEKYEKYAVSEKENE